MKTSHLKITVIVIVLVGIIALVWSSKKNGTVNHPPLSEQTSSIKGCYVATLAKDVYTLSILSQDGETFKGTLSFKNFEKDSSSGSYEGTYKDGILLGDYSFQSEGMFSVMQVIFKKSGNDFVRGYGDMNSIGTRFADLSKITYDTQAVFKANPSCASR